MCAGSTSISKCRCAVGSYMDSTQTCVRCTLPHTTTAVGSRCRYSAASRKCNGYCKCEVGFYANSTRGDPLCLACPSYSSNPPGSRGIKSCKCEAGYFDIRSPVTSVGVSCGACEELYDRKTNAKAPNTCDRCAPGYYILRVEKKLTCVRCPRHTMTRGRVVRGAADCFERCPEGQFAERWIVGRQRLKRTHNRLVPEALPARPGRGCIACPGWPAMTSPANSSSIMDCVDVRCTLRRVTVGGVCRSWYFEQNSSVVGCRTPGYYPFSIDLQKDTPYGTICVACPAHTTSRAQATSPMDCRICAADYYLNTSVPDAPTASPSHFQFPCIRCPEDSTSRVGGSSLDSCTCSPGLFMDTRVHGGTCVPCPLHSTAAGHRRSLTDCRCWKGCVWFV